MCTLVHYFLAWVHGGVWPGYMEEEVWGGGGVVMGGGGGGQFTKGYNDASKNLW